MKPYIYPGLLGLKRLSFSAIFTSFISSAEKASSEFLFLSNRTGKLMISGGATVILAMGQAKTAAKAMDKYLKTGEW